MTFSGSCYICKHPYVNANNVFIILKMYIKGHIYRKYIDVQCTKSIVLAIGLFSVDRYIMGNVLWMKKQAELYEDVRLISF